MSREIKVSSGAFQCDLGITFRVIDEDKFKSECEQINKFFLDDKYRKNKFGSHAKAGFALFCAECFQQMAFNNFKDECWLTAQFNYDKGEGIEGFPSLEDMGAEILHAESWFIDANEIDISGW
ncbi:TPA: DUF2528 family protein [Morganella morganii]|nr:DUF2528 family protein [Morganella morganii]